MLFRSRLYFATQVEVGPPTIVISASAPRSVSDPYRRYLLNAFRKELPFHEVPIRLYVRGKAADDAAHKEKGDSHRT